MVGTLTKGNFMPCNSDHMNPHPNEVVASQCLTLLDELNGKEFKSYNYKGYHPKAYGKGLNKEDCDKLTSNLCSKLQEIEKRMDITKYSLELQMWWRDHKEADKKREEKEKEKLKNEKLKKKALSKLTKEERLALGLNDGMPF